MASQYLSDDTANECADKNDDNVQLCTRASVPHA